MQKVVKSITFVVGGLINTTTPTSIKIESDIKARVQKLAKAKQRSSHWLMREAIREYVEREEHREVYKQDAMTAWDDFQSTGMHLTSSEVTDWIESWGTEDEKDAPKCHK